MIAIGLRYDDFMFAVLQDFLTTRTPDGMTSCVIIRVHCTQLQRVGRVLLSRSGDRRARLHCDTPRLILRAQETGAPAHQSA